MATKTKLLSRPTRDRRKNPKGGLTAKGRKAFKKSIGAHLKAGVKGEADTPEKMRRKGSFLRRHYGHAPDPLEDKKGKPTRYALQAQAWGEKAPRTAKAVKRLAAKGKALLNRYRKEKAKPKTKAKSAAR